LYISHSFDWTSSPMYRQQIILWTDFLAFYRYFEKDY
jgi:hypothetical protein